MNAESTPPAEGESGATLAPDSRISPILQARGLTKRFGGMVAIDDVTFDVVPGRITAIVGPNGAGKTTLFDLVSGFLPPDAGTVEFRGRKISGLPSHVTARLGIGRVFQDVRLFTGMTVLDNLLVSARSQRGENPLWVFFKPGQVREQERLANVEARKLLEFIGQEGRTEQLAGTLSGGQQRALAIARVLMLGAEVLMLDEPTAGLDPERVQDMLGLIRRLKESGKTILLVEHRLDVVRDIADTVICLSQGAKLMEGPPAEVLEHQDFVRAYLGS